MTVGKCVVGNYLGKALVRVWFPCPAPAAGAKSQDKLLAKELIRLLTLKSLAMESFIYLKNRVYPGCTCGP